MRAPLTIFVFLIATPAVALDGAAVRSGYSYAIALNHPSQEAARAEALRICYERSPGSACEDTFTFSTPHGSCVAIVRRSDGVPIFFSKPTRELAASYGLSSCGSTCTLADAVCNSEGSAPALYTDGTPSGFKYARAPEPLLTNEKTLMVLGGAAIILIVLLLLNNRRGPSEISSDLIPEEETPAETVPAADEDTTPSHCPPETEQPSAPPPTGSAFSERIARRARSESSE